jgi:hypothetical protein
MPQCLVVSSDIAWREVFAEDRWIHRDISKRVSRGVKVLGIVWSSKSKVKGFDALASHRSNSLLRFRQALNIILG